MPKARIVVVEDEPAIRRGVVDALRLTGYDVAEAADGPAGLKEAQSGGVDLVLLDLMLPKKDGFEVLAELRRVCPTRPVIILTAKGGEDDRVRGLKMGADDYVVKPFSARELVARVEAVLRRTLRPADDVSVVLLDIMLPKRDGLEVLSDLRRTHPARPVILLTARGSEDDRVRGLKMGADDYVVKPFSAKELIARVEAILRRTMKPVPDVRLVEVGSGTIDLHRREIRWADGARADLSETEAALLKYLVCNRERAVSREELLSRVWGIGTAGLETRAVDMHVARLRAKLKDPAGDDDQPEAIVTVRAHGYMAGPALTVPEEAATAVASGKPR